MNERTTVQRSIDALFFRPAQAAAARGLHPLGTAAALKAGAPAPAAPAAPARLFSSFDNDDMDEVHDLVAEFNKIWDVDNDPGSVIARAAEQALVRGTLVVQHALRVFAASVTGFDYKIPTLREQLRAAGGVPAAAPRPPTPEPPMDYFRNDIDLSDHHEHWHTVYPAQRDADSPIHGQLFLYMHEQMLARYDTDRRALGLDVVDPYASTFDGYSRAVPSTGVPRWVQIVYRHDDGTPVYVPRPEPYVPAQIPGLSRVLDLQKASFAGFRLESYPSAESLGRDIEGARYYPTDPPPNNMHNMGHGLLAFTGHEQQNPRQTGVMSNTATAVTDPVFFRWHRRIDDASFAWQERQSPNELTQLDPDNEPARVALGLSADNRYVSVRRGSNGGDSPDLFVVPLDALGGANWKEFGTATFGKDWDRAPDDPSFAKYRIGGLGTNLVTDPDTREEKLQLADHFVYYVRVENTNPKHALKVVFRVFLVAEEFYAGDDRRHVIEMDKFSAKVDAAAKAVIARPSWFSTVIRRKTVSDEHTIPDTLAEEAADPNEGLNAWCDCGLPYRLLLPRGKPDGMPFKLIVVMTDGEDDLINYDEVECGSVSYCGRKAKQSRNFAYNDARQMGYPFDRRLADENTPPKPMSMREILGRAENVAIRSVTIANTVKLT
ncbi:MAG: hemocyanin chain [Candidatus Eremiobacteraeota bacterium]|nr:hemocyanin chain [Candidatus Eremiobacteraeota bacterium]